MTKKDLKKATLKKVFDTNLIAWESLLSKILNFRSRSYCLKESKKIKTIQNRCRAFSQFELKYGYLAKEEMLVGRFTKDPSDVNKVKELILSVFKYVKDPVICDLTIAEILTKVLAYRELEKNQEIELPVNINGNISLETYKIDKVFNLWNSMRAFGLISKNGKQSPILIFRGTDFNLASIDGRTSIISNFDPDGPGKSVYAHARPSIQKWLKKVCSEDVKARAMGYSLGGALASYALITDPEFFSQKISESSYLFHHPGVSEHLFEQWEKIPKEKRPSVEGFVAQGDFVSKYGKLFNHTYEMKPKDEHLAPIESHTSLFFLKHFCNLAEIDVSEENKSTSRKSYSKFHETTSNLFYNAGIKFLLPNGDDSSDVG